MTSSIQIPIYPASVEPRPTRRKLIQTGVAGDAAGVRAAAFRCGHGKSDASIWPMTPAPFYNPQDHRTATAAQSNSFR
jgi:hypothetical protein